MKIVVIRSTRFEETLEFFQALGLSFVQEKHGKGPVHYACENNGMVFEIYPAKSDGVIYDPI